MHAGYTVNRQCSNPTNYTLKCGYGVGDPIAHEADYDGNGRTQVVEGSLIFD